MKPTHGPAKYLEDLKKRQSVLRKIVKERIEKSQQTETMLRFEKLFASVIKVSPLEIRYS